MTLLPHAGPTWTLPTHGKSTWTDSGGHDGCRIDGDLVREAVMEACPAYLTDEAAEDIADRTLAELAGMAGVTVLRGCNSAPWVPSHPEREPMPDRDPRLDGDMLYEKLAALEHIRWSEWQRHMHSLGERREDGSLVIPAGAVTQWERHMHTPYGDLSAREKQEPRAQVSRYWPLIRPGRE